MHLLHLFILFAIPSVLLAEICPYQFKNPRTQRIETIWVCCRGYKAGSAGHCVPICATPCENGRCVVPNMCSCIAGYRNLDNNTSKRCVPHCDPECTQNTQCVAPNVCQ